MANSLDPVAGGVRGLLAQWSMVRLDGLQLYRACWVRSHVGGGSDGGGGRHNFAAQCSSIRKD